MKLEHFLSLQSFKITVTNFHQATVLKAKLKETYPTFGDVFDSQAEIQNWFAYNDIMYFTVDVALSGMRSVLLSDGISIDSFTFNDFLEILFNQRIITAYSSINDDLELVENTKDGYSRWKS